MACPSLLLWVYVNNSELLRTTVLVCYRTTQQQRANSIERIGGAHNELFFGKMKRDGGVGAACTTMVGSLLLGSCPRSNI